MINVQLQYWLYGQVFTVFIMNAASKGVQLITCPVCLNIYDNPLLLSCLHTVCAKCVQYNNPKLPKVQIGFICPVCKDVVKDVTRDHSKQALLNMYHQRTSVTIQTAKASSSESSQTFHNGSAGVTDTNPKAHDSETSNLEFKETSKNIDSDIATTSQDEMEFDDKTDNDSGLSESDTLPFSASTSNSPDAIPKTTIYPVLDDESLKASSDEGASKLYVTELNTSEVQSKCVNAENLFVEDSKPSSVTNHLLLCQTCRSASNKVDWKCTICTKVFCMGCKKVHDSFPSCKGHYVKSIIQTAEDVKSKLRENNCTLQNIDSSLSQHLEIIANFKNSLKQTEVDAIKAINGHEEEQLKELREHHNKLRNEVEIAYNSVMGELQITDKGLKEKSDQVKGDMKIIKEIVETDDSEAVVYKTEGQGCLTVTLDDSLKVEVPKLILPPKLEVDVMKENHVEISRSIAVKIRSKPHEIKVDFDEPDDAEPRANYSDVLQNVYKSEKAVTLKYSPRKVCLLGEYIWCAGPTALYVYNKNGTLVKTVTHEKIQQVKSMVATRSNHIIVACWDNKGIVQLDQSGIFQRHLSSGSFSDVATWKGNLFALSYQDGTVHKFIYNHLKWTMEKEIKVSYTNGNNWDAIQIHQGSIFISAWGNHCIYHYSLDGHLINKFGHHGRSAAGYFIHPRMSDIDAFGNILLADAENHKLQIFDHSKGEWHFISMIGNIRQPVDAVIDPVTGALWVIQNIPGETHRLHKFNIK